MPVEPALRVSAEKLRVYGAFQSDNAFIGVTRRVRAVKRGFAGVDDVAEVVVLHTFQQFEGNDAVLSAAYRDKRTFALSAERVGEAGDIAVIRFYAHEAVDVGINAVAVEEFTESAEIKLLPPLYLLPVQSAALYLHKGRAGAFPVAHKLGHSYQEYHILNKFPRHTLRNFQPVPLP